ncbi:MAG: SCO family protein [Candidatus Eremiobacteraeota bacterium]|nr:SCO family protein [Candidatus Eremiobacteraeota bacterium]
MIARIAAIAALSLLCTGAGPLAVAASAPPPLLIDQTGRAFSLPSLEGRPLAVTFISAHCTDACPLIDAQFARAAERLARERIGARLLTITLDPEHDSPTLMHALATQFGADSRYWLLASGKPPDVDAVLAQFGVVAQLGKSGYREAHTTFVYVFDARGNLARTLLASTGLSDDVVDAVRTL